MGEILSKVDKIVLDSEAAGNLLPDILLDCLPRTREALHKNGERRAAQGECKPFSSHSLWVISSISLVCIVGPD